MSVTNRDFAHSPEWIVHSRFINMSGFGRTESTPFTQNPIHTEGNMATIRDKDVQDLRIFQRGPMFYSQNIFCYILLVFRIYIGQYYAHHCGFQTYIYHYSSANYIELTSLQPSDTQPQNSSIYTTI
jgi:hypothetical protein